MASAKQLVYAPDEQRLAEAMERAAAQHFRYPQYTAYLEALYCRRREWALCLRRDAATDGHNTNNVAEAAFRVLKDSILQR